MPHRRPVQRRLFAIAALLAAALTVALPRGAAAATGSQAFTATGAYQSFTVPAGVTGVVAELNGAGGNVGTIDPGPGTAAGGLGAQADFTLPVSPAQVLEVGVGTHSPNAAGGFNGGGDGSTDPSGGCCPGGGGGGASDIRSGACAATLTCTPATRLAIAGGGGGGGGGSTAAEPGGDAGAAGTNGTDVPAAPGSGGGGATTAAPGTGGLGSAAGTAGDPGIVGLGGPGGGGGGGGGGGAHGGGGGAADNVPNAAGGGGGSSLVPVPGHIAGGINAGDGTATIYWMTWSPAAPTVGQSVTLVSHMPVAAAGGRETFNEGGTILCLSVLVAVDGSASCTVTLALGSHTLNATYGLGGAQFDALTQTSVVAAVAVPATPTPTAVPVPSAGAASTINGGLPLGALLVLVGVGCCAGLRRRRGSAGRAVL